MCYETWRDDLDAMAREKAKKSVKERIEPAKTPPPKTQPERRREEEPELA